jgi:hypothetical protein
VATVSFSGKAGRTYTLQHTFSLSPAGWSSVSTLSATNDNQAITLSDSTLSGKTQAFLRVLVTYP